MKCRLLILFFLAFLSLSRVCLGVSIDEAIEELLPDEKECYHWNALHNPDALNVPEEELSAYLDDKISQLAVGMKSTRDIEVILFIARKNGFRMDSPQVQAWNELVLNVDVRDFSHQLVDEIATNLVRSGIDPQTKEQLLFAESCRLREATFSALALYGDEASRIELLKRYQMLEEDYRRRTEKAAEIMQSDFEQGKRLIKEIQNERKTNLFAFEDLADYIFYQKNGVAHGLSGHELLEWMGRHQVHKISSTSTDIYGGGGAFLAPSLSNLYWLEKINEVFESATNHEERIQLENAYREGFNEALSDSMRHAVRLYYLLGFELTEAEKAFLLRDTGLSQDNILPSGRVHMLGSYPPITIKEPGFSKIPPAPPEMVETTKELPTVKYEGKKSAEIAPIKVAEEPAEELSQWWLWLLGALVVIVGGLGLLVLRK